MVYAIILEITVPIVTGGPNDPECPDGLWEDIKKESTSVSNNQLLRSGKRGKFYYRLPNTGEIAIHQANPVAKISRAYTEGCIGVSESNTASPEENYEDMLSIIGDKNVTIYVK